MGGAKVLRKSLIKPLTDLTEINDWLDVFESIISNDTLFTFLRDNLSNFYSFDSIMNKLVTITGSGVGQDGGGIVIKLILNLREILIKSLTFLLSQRLI